MAQFSSGSWVTAERVRVYPLILLATTLLVLAYLFATGHGANDLRGRPLGTDFSNVYAAGTYARDGQAADAYVPVKQHAREQVIFGEKTPFYGWHYPPFFLLLAWAFAGGPYLWALLGWQLGSFALYLRAMWQAWPDKRVPWAAAGFPAVMINAAHGHNGFLTTALLVGALALLRPRPLLAGVLIGLLAYKPQFGLVIPLALLAGGHWRSIVSASVTVLAMALLVTGAFGAEVWQGFLSSLDFTRTVVLEQGGTGFYKMQSVFAMVRLAGGGITAAYLAQGLTVLLLLMSLAWLWRSKAAEGLKYAGLILACLLATPYSLDYDLMLMAGALLFLAQHGLQQGFVPYEKSLLAVAWTVPLYARVFAAVTFVNIGAVMLILLYLIVLQRSLSRGAAGA